MFKKPKLEDFGVTQKDYDDYLRKQGKSNYDLIDEEYGGVIRAIIVIISMSFPAWIIIDDASNIDVGGWIGLPIGLILFVFAVYLMIGIPVSALIVYFASSITKNELKVTPNLEKYLKAENEYNREIREQERYEREKLERENERVREVQRRDINYWKSLLGKGIEFENEIKKLYEELGYKVKKTPASGDQGVDLIIYDGEEEIFVQCKSQKEKLSPKLVREFYGAFRSRTQKGIIVTINGASENAYRWAKDKNIEFVDVNEIVEMKKKATKAKEY